MKRSEIAAARVQAALARRRGKPVSEAIRLLAETPMTSAEPRTPPLDQVTVVQPVEPVDPLAKKQTRKPIAGERVREQAAHEPFQKSVFVEVPTTGHSVVVGRSGFNRMHTKPTEIESFGLWEFKTAAQLKAEALNQLARLGIDAAVSSDVESPATEERGRS